LFGRDSISGMRKVSPLGLAYISYLSAKSTALFVARFSSRLPRSTQRRQRQPPLFGNAFINPKDSSHYNEVFAFEPRLSHAE
jgi:hypothetical protein